MKSDLPLIKNILDLINQIKISTTNCSKTDFLKDKDIQDANALRVLVIGECAKSLSKELRESHSKVEWSKIIGTRDRMAHNYFGTNLDILWSIINKDIFQLEENIKKIELELQQEESL